MINYSVSIETKTGCVSAATFRKPRLAYEFYASLCKEYGLAPEPYEPGENFQLTAGNCDTDAFIWLMVCDDLNTYVLGQYSDAAEGFVPMSLCLN